MFKLNHDNPTATLIALLLLFGAEVICFGLPPLLWARIGRQQWRDAFSLRPTSLRELYGATLLAIGMIAATPLILALQNLVYRTNEAKERLATLHLGYILHDWPVLASLLIPLVAAVTEEMFFRGVLQRALLRRWPAWLAIGAGAVLFSAAHLDVAGFVVRLLLGIILSWLVYRGGSIFSAMWLHFAYDGILLSALAAEVRHFGMAELIRQAQTATHTLTPAQLASITLWSAALLAAGFWLCGSEHRKRARVAAIEAERRRETLPESGIDFSIAQPAGEAE
jgi:membrane protease YdiL (CAAX protease family)